MISVENEAFVRSSREEAALYCKLEAQRKDQPPPTPTPLTLRYVSADACYCTFNPLMELPTRAQIPRERLRAASYISFYSVLWRKWPFVKKRVAQFLNIPSSTGSATKEQNCAVGFSYRQRYNILYFCANLYLKKLRLSAKSYTFGLCTLQYKNVLHLW